MLLIMGASLSKKFSENSTFQRILADALSIQDRFQAEPVYSRTGRGFLKSAGVGELQEIKKMSRKNQRATPSMSKNPQVATISTIHFAKKS